MVQVLSLTVFALLLARVMRAPTGTWRWIVGAAAAVLLSSQILPAGNPFRENVRDSAESLGWLALALLPIAAYALLIRRIRRRTLPPEERAGLAHPVGLVLVPEDRALTRDTEAALAAEGDGEPAETLSVGWRNPAGGMVGHVRIRIAQNVATLEVLWVAASERGQGIGSRLLAGAGSEARLRGAGDMIAPASSPAAAAFLERNGFRRCGGFSDANGNERLDLHKALG